MEEDGEVAAVPDVCLAGFVGTFEFHGDKS